MSRWDITRRKFHRSVYEQRDKMKWRRNSRRLLFQSDVEARITLRAATSLGKPCTIKTMLLKNRPLWKETATVRFPTRAPSCWSSTPRRRLYPCCAAWSCDWGRPCNRCTSCPRTRGSYSTTNTLRKNSRRFARRSCRTNRIWWLSRRQLSEREHFSRAEWPACRPLCKWEVHIFLLCVSNFY